MKNMNSISNIKSLAFVLIFILGIGLNSCVVERGPAGPQGDNVINTFVTYNFNIRAIDWVVNNQDNSTYLYYKNIPEITNDVINNGFVLAYARIDGKPWVQLPMTNFYNDNGTPYTLEYLPYHTAGGFELQYVDSHPQPIAPTVFTELKVVVVEGEDYMNAIKHTDKANVNEVLANLTRTKSLIESTK